MCIADRRVGLHKGEVRMSAQVVSAIVLTSGDIEAKVYELQPGSSMQYIRITKVGEIEGVTLHASATQLHVIIEALDKWKDESLRPVPYNISQLQLNGESSKM